MMLYLAEIIAFPFLPSKSTSTLSDDDLPIQDSSLIKRWEAALTNQQEQEALQQEVAQYDLQLREHDQMSNGVDELHVRLNKYDGERQKTGEDGDGDGQLEISVEANERHRLEVVARPSPQRTEDAPKTPEDFPETPPEIKSNVCRYPDFNLNDDTIGQYFDHPAPLDCGGMQLFFFQNGQLRLNEELYNKAGLSFSRCSFRVIEWKDDNSFVYGEETLNTVFPFVVSVKHDFFRVQCHSKVGQTHKKSDNERPNDDETDKTDGNLDADKEVTVEAVAAEDISSEKNDDEVTYEQFIAQVSTRLNVKKRAEELLANMGETNSQMNVLIFAVESLSRLSAMRLLPKTYAFLRNDLKAVVLNGYNTVGESTTGSIIPLLTGYY